jgi:hypothetical protein
VNEDWMTEVEVRAGEGLERQLERYARVRLDPSAAQAKRARAALMEAAWRRRIAGSAPSAAPVREHRGRDTGWGPRRVGASFAAAVLAGLLVGSTAFATSRAGGPFYDIRLALEEATLPTDPEARLEAELAIAQSRLAEIVEASAREDGPAVTAAVRGYLASLGELSVETGEPADRAQIAIAFHRTVLLDVLDAVPEQARSGIENALSNSSKVIDRLDSAGTTPASNGNGSGTSDGNGSGSGGTGAGNGNGGTGAGNGNGDGTGPSAKPSKDPQPARTPRPARTPDPADPDETRKPRPTPKVDPKDKDDATAAPGSASGGGQGGQP